MKRATRAEKKTRRATPSLSQQLQNEIEAVVDLIATNIAPITSEKRALLTVYLTKLTVATTYTALPVSEQEAITALCEEVLILAASASVDAYGDKLRAMVRATALGELAYRQHYTVEEAIEE